MESKSIGVNFRLSYPWQNKDRKVLSNHNYIYNKNKRYIFRSGSCEFLSTKEIKRLCDELHVKTWIDLRTTKETKSYLWEEEFLKNRIHYKHLPLEVRTYSFLPLYPTAKDYLEYYKHIILNEQKILNRIFCFLNEALKEGSIVISCYAGKDRTGLMCYLIHKILGTPNNFIEQDFVMSKKYLYYKKHLFLEKAQNKNLSLDDYISRFSLCKEIYELFNCWFSSKYSINSFMKNNIGFDKISLIKLRGHFSQYKEL